jgi:hypothetical protein
MLHFSNNIINKRSNAQLDYVEDLYLYLNLEEGDSTNTSIDVTNVNEIIYIRLLVIKDILSLFVIDFLCFIFIGHLILGF